MVHVHILAVGSLKESYWREACAEYQKRLGPFCRLRIIEIAEYRLPNDPSPAQIEQGVVEEGKRILEKIPQGAALFPLCIEGKTIPSSDFAKTLERAMGQSSQLCFVIGGSYGLWEEIKKKAFFPLSLSPMTFPHQLARVLLLEQIYRGLGILQNNKYHK